MIYALVEATGAVLCGGEPAPGEDWNWPMHRRRDAAWTKLRETLRGSRKLVHKSTFVTACFLLSVFMPLAMPTCEWPYRWK